MISDSCYSGSFARERPVDSIGVDTKPDEILYKRTVVAAASGGEQPVTDNGKGGHSIFAWYLMKALGDIENWQPGSNIFEQVRLNVRKAFPQTPQYGAVISAGHEIGGDYLFGYK